MKLAQFMATWPGRLVRILAGLALIVWGFRQGTPVGIAVGIFGFLPLAAGLFNFCAISFLVGAPFWGRDATAAGGRGRGKPA